MGKLKDTLGSTQSCWRTQYIYLYLSLVLLLMTPSIVNRKRDGYESGGKIKEALLSFFSRLKCQSRDRQACTNFVNMANLVQRGLLCIKI